MIGHEVTDCGNADEGCDFCKFAKNSPFRDAWIIWVQNCNERNLDTGLPTEFYVYLQDRPGSYGSHKTYYAPTCYWHARQAFIVMQETYLDEVKEADRTEAWLWRRNSRL